MPIEPMSVLVVTGTDKGASVITDMFDKTRFSPITAVLSGMEARRQILRADYDIVVVNTPLPDEFGHDLAIHITEKTLSGVIVMVKNQLFDSVSSKVEDYGVLTVSKPVDKHIFYQVCKLLIASRNKFSRFRSENEKLQTKLEETRIVSRAKCILVEYLKMNEAQAHRYIEKQAMDMRTTRKSVAEELLRTYEQ